MCVFDDEKKGEKGDEEKLVYVAVTQFPHNRHRIYVINPHKGDDFMELVDVIKYPNKLLNITSYECAVHTPSKKIYFMGGHYSIENIDFPTKDAFVYSITKKTWKTAAPMQSPRSIGHRAVAVRSKIYVFGCAHNPSVALSRKEWAECYDIFAKKWSYLPMVPKEAYGEVGADICSIAVYERTNTILLWIYDVGIYAFDYVNYTWTRFNFPPVPWNEPLWSNRISIVGNVAFSHYFGHIYAYDFVHQYILDVVPVPELACSYDDHPNTSYLVPVGNGKLCLILVSEYPDQLLCCFRFALKSSPAHLLLEDSQSFSIGKAEIEAVVQV